MPRQPTRPPPGPSGSATVLVRLHQRRRPAINAVRDELMRRGLPARRAVRYARELQAHWEDLRDELLGNGAPEPAAEAGADQRLGAPRELVAAAVMEHRRERFSARHPVVGFVLVPFGLVPLLPVCLVILVLLPLSLIFGRVDYGDDREDAAAPPPAMTSQETRSVLNVIVPIYVAWYAWAYCVPAGLAVLVHGRARRRTLSPGWAWAASAAVAVSAGMQRIELQWLAKEPRPVTFRFAYGGWPDASILVVVLSVTALAALAVSRSTGPSASPSAGPLAAGR